MFEENRKKACVWDEQQSVLRSWCRRGQLILFWRFVFVFCFVFPFIFSKRRSIHFDLFIRVCIFMRMFVRFVYVYFTSLKSNYILRADYNLKLPTPYWIQNPYFTSFFFFSFCFLSLPMGRGGGRGAAHYARWPQNVWCFQGLCVSSTHGRFSFPLG